MNLNKKIVLITACLAVFFLAGAGFYQQRNLPQAVHLNTAGQPSVGSGAVEVVVFEDLKCVNCRVFGEEILPQISTKLVNTGRVKLTVIPVAFQEQSKLSANAVLGVYKTTPNRFVPFVLELLRRNATGREEILEAAKTVGGIQIDALTFCMDHRLYDYEIERNLSLGQSLLGDEFGTPTLYVNGIITPTDSFDTLVQRIEQIEAKQ